MNDIEATNDMSTCITFQMSFIDFLPPHKTLHTHTDAYDDANRQRIRSKHVQEEKNFMIQRKKLLSLKFICIWRSVTCI